MHTQKASKTKAQPIIIDTDPGQDIDDLLAIHFALLRPELDILAITTATWPSDQRARLIKRLLRFTGRSDITVAAGSDHPLRAMNEAETNALHNINRSMNHACFAEPQDSRDVADSTDAAGLIIRTIEQYPDQVILACIAPLTNIAMALCRRPDIADKIKGIAMMGGDVALNRKEHNVAFDYVAANIVLSAGIPVYMGTWSVTRRFTLPMSIIDRFKDQKTPLGAALAESITRWHPVQSRKPGPVMYDIFPIIHAMGLPYYTLEKKSVRVETEGTISRGITMPGGDYDHIYVTTDIDAERVSEIYMETVFG